MKMLWKDMTVALLMGAVLPGIMVQKLVSTKNVGSETVMETEQTVTESAHQTPSWRILMRHNDGTVSEMELEHYLVGVVLAEMPAYFEEEALKAQAVVARTYTLKTCTWGGKHGDGSICTDWQCCQAYRSVLDYLQQGGTGESADKVRKAVADTAGQVLTYEEDLIEATYFSCSGGITEDAHAVWGTDYAYLRSVPSPGEENASCFTDTVSFDLQQFQERLGISLTGTADQWFGPVTYTTGKGVATMQIGGTEFAGTQLRNLLGLRSTLFEMEAAEDEIRIHTKGYGHRVGMSQYGADAMAVNGSTYDEILAYYYQGTELTDMEIVN